MIPDWSECYNRDTTPTICAYVCIYETIVFFKFSLHLTLLNFIFSVNTGVKE